MAEHKEFYRGHSKGRKDKRGFPSIINGDIHSVVGALTCSRALDERQSSLAETYKISTKTPYGDVFFANSTNGKIYRERNGAVALVHTNSNGANFSMEYSRGYVFYASATKLGRIPVANSYSENTWTSHDDNWQTFTNTNDTIFKMCEVRGKLLIPNKNKLAMVTYLGAFNANALDFYPDYTMTAVHVDEITAIIMADNGVQTAILTWDTLKSTWLIEDYIPEVGGNMFIDTDNFVAMQIGSIGNIYQWDGRKAYLWRRLRNNGTITTSLNPFGSANINGLTLIATGQGIYSLGRSDASMPIADVIEYTSENSKACYAVEAIGNNVIVSTTDSFDRTTSGYATCTITTPEDMGSELIVQYDELSGDATITAQISKDGNSFTTHTLKNSSNSNRTMKSASQFKPKNRMQAKVILTPDSTDVPVIDKIIVS